MFPFKLFRPEATATNLPQQVRWHDGLYCPHCRSKSVIYYGNYRLFQRYRCEDCGRTFNDKIGTILTHAKVGLGTLLFAFYSLLRFDTGIRQSDAETDVSYRPLRQRVDQFARTLDAPVLNLTGPVKIDKLYVSVGFKGCECDGRSRSRGLSKCGRGNYINDKLSAFTLTDRSSDQRHTIPVKSADESTVRLLPDTCEDESLTVYTDGLQAYYSPEDNGSYRREAVIHCGDEYVDGDAHVNTCESHASLVRRWLSLHRGISKDRLTPYLQAFQLRREVFRKPGKQALKICLKLHYDS